jgi:hypothetical protein
MKMINEKEAHQLYIQHFNEKYKDLRSALIKYHDKKVLDAIEDEIRFYNFCSIDFRNLYKISYSDDKILEVFSYILKENGYNVQTSTDEFGYIINFRITW